MRIGSIVYATVQGLGVLAKSFYDHEVFHKAFIIEHPRHKTYLDWYPPDTLHNPIRAINPHDVRRFVEDIDILLCFETPFEWSVVEACRRRGIKTVLMPMYECSFDKQPNYFDEYWCPSLLDLQYFTESHTALRNSDLEAFVPYTSKHGTVARFTPVPVQVPWTQRERANTFIHNAGHGGLKGRNGTKELVEALKMIETSPQIIIRSQSRDEWLSEAIAKVSSRVNVHYSHGTIRYEDLYRDGDVFIFPEQFNGLSLPLQEARASGMLVMATDRYPMNTWLPREALIETSGMVSNRIGPPYLTFDQAIISPRAIAQKIDEWTGRDISEYSRQGQKWAESMSWEVLGPKYREVLEGLL